MAAQGEKKGQAKRSVQSGAGWRNCKAWVLVLALVAVVGGSVLFVGAVSGWFDDPKVKLDEEYYSENGGMVELSASEYEKLVEEQKSFVVLIDQDGCTTADRLREYVENFAREMGVVVYRMMFAEMKETSLHDSVKYYPSVAVIGHGVVKAYLRADSDEDAEMYNNYDELKKWVGNIVE